MKQMPFAIALLVAASVASGQLTAPQHAERAINASSLVVLDRGALLEVLPATRAIPYADPTETGVRHQLINARPDAAISARKLGVVFNHAMQQQGYISGEITFALKPGRSVSSIGGTMFGRKRIVRPSTYVVSTRTPSEFIAELKYLQDNANVEWVAPTVIYGPSDATVLP